METIQIIPFQFKTTEIRTIEIDNLIWFIASDIAKALEYSEAKDMARLLDEDEKGRHIVPTPSGNQEMVIINESGLYHAILKSRKPEARPFRKWVTAEVLPSIRKTGKYEAPQQKAKPKALPNGLTTEQQEAIKALVKARVDALPEEKRAKAAVACWSSLKSKFGMTYKAIQPDQFTDAISLVARLSLEGELLPKETPLCPVTKVNWPASRWLAESTPRVRDTMTLMQGAGTLMVSPEMLFGPPDEFISPTLKAIAELERLGHNLEACRLEVLAMKHHLEGAHHLFEGVRLWAEQTKGRGVRFKIQS